MATRIRFCKGVREETSLMEVIPIQLRQSRGSTDVGRTLSGRSPAAPTAPSVGLRHCCGAGNCDDFRSADAGSGAGPDSGVSGFRAELPTVMPVRVPLRRQPRLTTITASVRKCPARHHLSRFPRHDASLPKRKIPPAVLRKLRAACWPAPFRAPNAFHGAHLLVPRIARSVECWPASGGLGPLTGVLRVRIFPRISKRGEHRYERAARHLARTAP